MSQLGSLALHFQAAEHLSDLRSYPLCLDERDPSDPQPIKGPTSFLPCTSGSLCLGPLARRYCCKCYLPLRDPFGTTCHTAPPLTLIPRLSSWLSFLQSTNHCAVLCTCKHLCLGFPPPHVSPSRAVILILMLICTSWSQDPVRKSRISPDDSLK